MVVDYLPIFLQIVIAFGFGAVALLVSKLLGQRGKGSPGKDQAYECGKDPVGATPRFSIKFYMIAMLFILFDIETVFFYVWAVVFKDRLHDGLGILYAMLFFAAILFVGLAYELKKKALDWAH